MPAESTNRRENPIMLKKLVLGGLFLVLMAVLVVGAVVRTENRLGRMAVGSASGAGHGRDTELHPPVPHEETGGVRGRGDADHRDDTEDGADGTSGADAGVSTDRISRLHAFSTSSG